jgi:E3 ubiquitin-protein ligase CHFR
MSLVSFCGINVQGRCKALPLLVQEPHGLGDVADLIESTYVYDCFDGNTVEAEYVLDYLTTQGLTPTHIYREVRNWMISWKFVLIASRRLSPTFSPNPGNFSHL